MGGTTSKRSNVTIVYYDERNMIGEEKGNYSSLEEIISAHSDLSDLFSPKKFYIIIRGRAVDLNEKINDGDVIFLMKHSPTPDDDTKGNTLFLLQREREYFLSSLKKTRRMIS